MHGSITKLVVYWLVIVQSNKTCTVQELKWTYQGSQWLSVVLCNWLWKLITVIWMAVFTLIFLEHFQCKKIWVTILHFEYTLTFPWCWDVTVTYVQSFTKWRVQVIEGINLHEWLLNHPTKKIKWETITTRYCSYLKIWKQIIFISVN